MADQNSNSNSPSRRIISTSNNSVVLVPAVDNLIADALQIIELELVKFKTKVKQGRSLDLKEGRLLNGYIKSMVELSKEDRERGKDADLSKLTTEEMIQLLQASLQKEALPAPSKASDDDGSES